MPPFHRKQAKSNQKLSVLFKPLLRAAVLRQQTTFQKYFRFENTFSNRKYWTTVWPMKWWAKGVKTFCPGLEQSFLTECHQRGKSIPRFNMITFKYHHGKKYVNVHESVKKHNWSFFCFYFYIKPVRFLSVAPGQLCAVRPHLVDQYHASGRRCANGPMMLFLGDTFGALRGLK